MRKYIAALVVTGTAVLTSGSAHAQTLDLSDIDPITVANSAVTQIGPYLATLIGVVLAIAVVAVIIRLFKRAPSKLAGK